MGEGLPNIKRANQSGWGPGITVRNRIAAPPKVQKVARVMAIVRALLSEVQEAKARYDEILLPMAVEVIDRSGGLPEIPDEASKREQIRIITDFAKRVNSLLTASQRQIIHEFVAEFLNGGSLASYCLRARLILDALGIDPFQVEAERQASNPVWAQKYERQSTRAGRLAQIALGVRLELLGWTRLEDDVILRRATMWVRAHCVWKNLSRAVEEYYNSRPPEISKKTGEPLNLGELVKWWDKVLKPYDIDIGRERQRGKRYQ
jgi:hypothetical protein